MTMTTTRAALPSVHSQDGDVGDRTLGNGHARCPAASGIPGNPLDVRGVDQAIPRAGGAWTTVMQHVRRLLNVRVLIHLTLVRPILRVLFRARIETANHEAIPGHFVLVANHNSHLDTALLFMALPISQISTTRPVAALDHFSRHPILFAAANVLFRPVWIDRDAWAETAIERIIEALDGGDSIILFPEGTRGQPGKFGDFRRGVGRLVQRRPMVPIVPAFLIGTDQSLPSGAVIPKLAPLRVIVGPPRRVVGAPGDTARTLRNAVEALGRVASSTKGYAAAALDRPLRIAVVGIDGCGKSTLSRQLARALSETSNTCLVSDTLEYYEQGRRVSRSTKWPETFRQWIGARAKRARSLAGYKIPKLIELLLRDIVAQQVERKGDANVIVMDGCPLINLVAFAILYHERRFDAQACTQAMAVLTSDGSRGNDSPLERVPELSLLVRLRLNRLRIPDATILLDVEPELALRRIGSRQTQRQVHENESSLSKLRSAYLTVHRILECHTGVVARRLDAAPGLDVLVEEALRFATGMRSRCHG